MGSKPRLGGKSGQAGLALLCLLMSGCSQPKSSPYPPVLSAPVPLGFAPTQVRLGQPQRITISHSAVGPEIAVYLIPQPQPLPSPSASAVSVVTPDPASLQPPTPAPLASPMPSAGPTRIVVGIALGTARLTQAPGQPEFYAGELMVTVLPTMPALDGKPVQLAPGVYPIEVADAQGSGSYEMIPLEVRP